MILKIVIAGLLIALGLSNLGEGLLKKALPAPKEKERISFVLPKIYKSLRVKTLHNNLAEGFIVLDLATGEIVTSKDAEKPLPLASLTKLMTAKVVADSKNNLSTVITIPDNLPSLPENLAGLKPKEEYEVQDLLQALLIHSANDAAYTLAQAVAKTPEEFAKLMNETARKYDFESFQFKDPAGLSKENIGSAKDVALLLTLVSKNPTLREILGKKEAEVIEKKTNSKRLLKTTSLAFDEFLIPGLVANKTGYLPESGYNYALIAKLPDEREVAIVILKAYPANKNSPVNAALQLLNSLEIP